MIALLGLLPCVAVIIAILVFKRSGVVAAGIAVSTAFGLWLVGAFARPNVAHLVHSLIDSVVLELLVGLVIFTGLLFVEISRRSGSLEALQNVIQAAKLSAPRSAVLVATGIGVPVESLTGYGVSMLVTVPLLLRLLPRHQAIAVALIGMCLMPWGALSVSALLGAELAGVPTDIMANAVITTSGPVAFLLPVLCLFAVSNTSGTKITWRDWLFALAAGVSLVVGIVATSRLVGIEVAGVGGGLAVLALGVVMSGAGRELLNALGARGLWPYPLLILAIVIQKLAVSNAEELEFGWVLSTGRVTFDVLASPAWSLLVASVVSFALSAHRTPVPEPPLVRNVAARAWRALLSVFLFLLCARVLVEIGAVSALASVLSNLGAYPAAAAVTILAGVGAYVTGSGVTANALFMPSAAATGEHLDVLTLFAALQHSGGGHVAMASLPVIALLIAALPSREPADEPLAVKTGLMLAGFSSVLVIASGWIQLAAR